MTEGVCKCGASVLMAPTISGRVLLDPHPTEAGTVAITDDGRPFLILTTTILPPVPILRYRVHHC